MNDQNAVIFNSVFQTHPTEGLFHAINTKLFVLIEDGH